MLTCETLQCIEGKMHPRMLIVHGINNIDHFVCLVLLKVKDISKKVTFSHVNDFMYMV